MVMGAKPASCRRRLRSSAWAAGRVTRIRGRATGIVAGSGASMEAPADACRADVTSCSAAGVDVDIVVGVRDGVEVEELTPAPPPEQEFGAGLRLLVEEV